MKSRKVLSLGAGVQSTFLVLAMTDKYKISKVNELIKDSVIIFSDTGSEKPETIKYFNEIIVPELKTSGIEYHVVYAKEGKLHEHYREKDMIPFRMYRSCTDKFKLRPIKKKVDEIFSDRKRGEKIQMFLGITTDEATRIKPSKITYFENQFPLIDLGYSRDDLFKIYEKWNLQPPVKSGCFCCPFARPSELIQLSYDHPKLIDIVIDLEENAIAKRESTKNYAMRLLNGKLTVKQLIQAEKEQTSLMDWDYDDDECSGMCFV